MLDAINTNIISLQTQNNLSNSQSSLATSIQRLSSGLKINSAMDDPAGLAIASRMTSQVNGLNQATQNANNGVSMLQTADGGLANTTSLLQSMRTLAVEAANGTNSASDLASLQTEIGQLQQQITQVSSQTQYNGTNLLNGSLSNVQFQVGANAGQTISFGIASSSGSVLGNNTLVADDTSTTAMTQAVTGAANAYAGSTITVEGSTASTLGGALAAGTSASGVAAAVNKYTNVTGVTATATTTATLGVFTAGTQSLSINGTAISASISNTTSGMDGLAAAINAATGSTGVTAIANDTNGTIALTDSSGANISMRNNNAATAVTLTGATGAGVAVAAAATGTVGGLVTFNSNNSFAVQDSLGTGVLNATTPIGSSLNSVAAINLSTTSNGTPTGANSALLTIDAAIQSVNTSRANLGALENRFTASISNLQTSTLNLTSSLSTVQDTNFASETANLSRGQILQQAGTAMLAQANSLPNGVLALLR